MNQLPKLGYKPVFDKCIYKHDIILQSPELQKWKIQFNYRWRGFRGTALLCLVIKGFFLFNLQLEALGACSVLPPSADCRFRVHLADCWLQSSWWPSPMLPHSQEAAGGSLMPSPPAVLCFGHLGPACLYLQIIPLLTCLNCTDPLLGIVLSSASAVSPPSPAGGHKGFGAPPLRHVRPGL